MSSHWPTISYGDWSETCDTLHAHTQVLGKLAVKLAPPEPQLQHAALRLTARGWETGPLPAPDGSGTFVVLLDLRSHDVVVEASKGAVDRIPLGPDRAVGVVTRDVLAAIEGLVGPVAIDPRPQEVPWGALLTEDEEHSRYDTQQVELYFTVATYASMILAAFRAPYRGRSTPVNAWWGSFDLAVSLFSGHPATPPSDDFIMRNAMDAQEVAIGWWPGDRNYGKAAFYAYAHPARMGSPAQPSHRRPLVGTPHSANTSSTGRTSVRATTRRPRPSSLRTRCFAMRVRSASGTCRCWRAWKDNHRQSSDKSPGQ